MNNSREEGSIPDLEMGSQKVEENYHVLASFLKRNKKYGFYVKVQLLLWAQEQLSKISFQNTSVTSVIEKPL